MIQIAGSQLSQWDVGRSVSVSDSKATHVHFANQGDSKAPIIAIENGEAKIPDYLLQTGKVLLAYAVLDGVTLESKSFAVRKRERPENYVYEDDRRNYIYELITRAEDAVENANQAAQKANEAAEKLGSIVIPTKVSQLQNDSGFLTKAPVTSVNGQTGDVQIPVAMKVTVTQDSEGSYYTDTDVDIIQEALEENRTVVCYWYKENIMLHLVTYIPNGPYVFTAIEGAKEYCVVIRDTEDVHCTVTKLSQGAAPQEATNVPSGPEPPTDGSNLWINPNEDEDEDDDYPGGTVDLSGYATEEYVEEYVEGAIANLFPSGGGSGGSASTFSLTLTTDEARKAVEIPLPVDLYDTLIFNIHATFPNVETAFNLYSMVTYGVNDTYNSLITIPASANTGFNLYAVKHYEEFHAYSVAAVANYPNNARPANTSNGVRIHKGSRKITLYSNTDGVLIPEGSIFEMWGVCRQ